MKDRSFFFAKVKNILLYGGISKEELVKSFL